jgi:hypothetical protein
MQTRNKFKQCVEGGFDVSNELTSSLMEDVALPKIGAFMVGIGATNGGVGSHELASANE